MNEELTIEQVEQETLAVSRMERRVAALLYAVQQHDETGAREEIEAARQIYANIDWIAKLISDSMINRIG